MLTRSKYVTEQEYKAPPPSIRFALSADHSPMQVEVAAETFMASVDEVLNSITDEEDEG